MTVNVTLGGTASFKANGTLYELAGSIKVDVGGVIRTPAVGPSGATGKWTERNDPPMVEVEVWDDPALSIQAIRAITGANVQLALNSGKSYILYNAFQTDKLELDAVAGKFTLKLSGTDCQEQTVTA